MKAIKRSVAALLAALMIATSAPVLAAESYTDAEAVVVAKVNAAGIMTGTDNGFEPSKTLTRAEAAAIMVRMKGIAESTVKSSAGSTLFTDVPASHWAAGYINVASTLGIINGVGNGMFAPDRTVTIAEFETMAIRALGAGTMVDTQGAWPVNYVNFANEEGISEDVYAIYTAEATRMNAATIIANTLEAPMWEKTKATTNKEVTWEKQAEEKAANGSVIKAAKTILSETLKIKTVDGSVLSAGTAIGKCNTVSNKDHEFNGIDVVETLDLSNVKEGLVYDYWMNDKNKIIGIWETENNDLTKVDFTEIVKVTTDKVTLKVDGKDKEYKVTDDFEVTINGKTVSLVSDDANVFCIAYLDGGKISSIYAEKYETYAIVDEVKTKSVKFKNDYSSALKEESSISIDEDKYDYFFTKNGNAFDVKKLKEGDAIAFYKTNEKYVGIVLEGLEGKVTAIGTKNTIKLDGKTYDVDSTLTFRNDQTIKVYFNNANDVVMFEKIDDAASDVAVIKSYRVADGRYSTSTKEYEVVLYYTDATASETLTVDLEETFDEYEKALDSDDIKEVAAGTADDDISLDDADAATVTVPAGKTYYAIASNKWYTTKEKAGAAIVTAVLGTEGNGQGKAVCYEVAGSKLTLIPADIAEPEYVTLSTDDSKLVFKSNSAYIAVDASDSNAKIKGKNLEVTSNTKFFKVKADKNYSVKFEEVSFDSLDKTNLKTNTILADIDYDDLTVETVFFAAGTTVNRTSDTNFAYVVDYSTSKNAKTIDVVMSNGSEKSFTVDDDADVYDELSGSLIGSVIDLTIVDNELVDIDDLTSTTGKTAYNGYYDDYLLNESMTSVAGLTFNNSHSMINLVKIDETEIRSLVLADDVIVLAKDSDGDYTVSSIEDIEDFDKDEDDNTFVLQVVTYTNDASDEDTEVVAIVYMEEDEINEVEAARVAAAINAGSTYKVVSVSGNVVVIEQAEAAALAKDATVAVEGIDFTCTKAGTTEVKAQLVATIKVK